MFASTSSEIWHSLNGGVSQRLLRTAGEWIIWYFLGHDKQIYVLMEIFMPTKSWNIKLECQSSCLESKILQWRPIHPPDWSRERRFNGIFRRRESARHRLSLHNAPTPTQNITQMPALFAIARGINNLSNFHSRTKSIVCFKWIRPDFRFSLFNFSGHSRALWSGYWPFCMSFEVDSAWSQRSRVRIGLFDAAFGLSGRAVGCFN